MKLSKQFMQTNLKWGYLYWQPVSLNHPQQGTDGQGPGKKTGGARASEAAFLPLCLPSFVTITGLFLFMSLIPLLFYVLVKPNRHFTRQVCSKTVCQPSWVTRSLAFDTKLGARSWLSLLEGGTAGSRNSLQMWIRDWQSLQDKHLESHIYLPFYAFVSTGHLPLYVQTRPGQGSKSWIQICPWPTVLTLDALSERSDAQWTEQGDHHLAGRVLETFKWYLNDAYIWVMRPLENAIQLQLY